MAVTITTHTDPAVFSELATEWHQLLSVSLVNHVFQTPEFLQTWWETLGEGSLTVLAVRTDTGKLVGVAPLFCHSVEGIDTLSFIGCAAVADYLDLIVAKEHETAVYEAVCEYLSQQSLPVSLCSIPDDSTTPSQLTAAFGKTAVTITQQDVTPKLSLPPTWETYLESLDRKQRHEIRRKWGKLEREVSHAFQVVTAASETEAATAEFIKLHQASSPGKARFWDEHHVKFFTLLLARFAAAGWLKLYFLEVEGNAAAAMLIFEYNQTYYLYNSGYDPEYFRHLSTGNTLLAYTIQQAIEHGCTCYDFLRGDEQYKFRFGAVAAPVWDVSLNTREN